MSPTKFPRVKICCIKNLAEAQLAIRCGASALGLVGPMPSGPGVITDEEIAQIAKKVPPGVSSFLLTSETAAQDIIRHHQRVHTSVIQIVDRLEEGTYAEIRAALPSVKLVQVIHVIDDKSVEEALIASRQVDAILLDSGNPNAAVKTLGGTGNVHNWDLSREIRERIKVPLFLAGGLRAENIRQAIEQVQPYGVDLCSGVRTDDQLDEDKLRAFFAALRG